MATEFHVRVQRALDQAVTQAPQAPAAHLRSACAADTRLLREALSLLPHYVRAAGQQPERPTALGDTLPRTTTLLRLRAAGRAAAEAEGDAEPQPPFSLDQYTVVQIVGRGGMGVVYRGIQPVREREVAIKLLRQKLSATVDRVRFAFEGEVLRQLQHPGIAQFLHSGVADLRGRRCNTLRPHPYFVMEFVRGEPLTWYAAARKLGTAERLDLLMHVCAAMEYAHYRGIVHCDLKPDNILVGADGVPKIVDFGIAQFTGLDAGCGQNGIGGTRAYASPEQMCGRADEIAAASDVYSLGVIAHELLAGARPRQNGWAVAVNVADVQVHPEAEPADNRAFAWQLGRILATALRAERGRRYTSAGQLGAELAALRAAFPVRLRSPFVKGCRTVMAETARLLNTPIQRPLQVILRSRVRMRMEQHRGETRSDSA